MRYQLEVRVAMAHVLTFRIPLNSSWKGAVFFRPNPTVLTLNYMGQNGFKPIPRPSRLKDPLTVSTFPSSTLHEPV